MPREIEFIDELPRKPQGKVDKESLKEQQGDEDGEDSGESGGGQKDSGEGEKDSAQAESS